MSALVVKSTLLLALTLLATWLLRRASASLVHRVWMIGLVAALAIPLVHLIVPGWTAGWFAAWLPAFDPGTSVESALQVVWLAGAAIGLAVLLGGAARLGWLVYHAEPLADSRWSAIAAELGSQLGLRRPVQLLVSRRVSFLGTWGVWRAHVLVPEPARDWNESRVRAVLAHELAHVARGDWPVQVLADAARAIYWFNPLFWLLASRLRRASEHAADNRALALGIGGAEYARVLLEVAGELGAQRRQAPILAMAQPSFLERRLVAVLDPKLRRLSAAPWATLVIVLFAVGISVPLAMFRHEPAAIGASDPASAAVPAGESCPVTGTLAARPPDPTLAAAFGEGPWHVNEDRSIWVWAQPYAAGKPVRAIWMRPEGSRLVVRSERLDGEAPSVEAEFACCYPTAFKTGAMTFPTPGCWRVEATAGDRRLSFTTVVSP